MVKLIYVFLISFKSVAGVLIEPGLQGTFGKWSVERSSVLQTVTAKGYSSGYGYGLRLGWQFDNFGIGGQYFQDSLTWKYLEDTTSTADDSFRSSKATFTNMGIYGEFHTEDKDFSLWAFYEPNSKIVISEDFDPAQNSPTYSGTSLGGVVAYKLFDFMKVGLGYRIASMTKLSMGGSDITMPAAISYTTHKSFSYVQYNVLFLFPFEFFESGMGSSKSNRRVRKY